ncbi:MAG: DUF3320 domain-containing protein, partial [Methanobrevibacter sp.]|nr:DUF3320 domain-containing protein [Methanobrevibacter sp.]
DGKMYSSSKVARDRDRLREQVLTGLGWKLYHLWSTDWYRNRDLGRKKLLENIEKSIRKTRAEEKRKSEEEKKLAEKRKLEAEKKAEELRIAREREEAERKMKEDQSDDDINVEDIGPSDFVEVEKVDDGDMFEKPIDVSEIDPSEFFGDDIEEPAINEDKTFEETPSEFVKSEPAGQEVNIEETPSEFVEAENEEVNIEDEPSVFVENPDVEFENYEEPSEEEVIPDTAEEPATVDVEDDDSEVWESDEGISPEDNAEVWENENDYADENNDSISKAITDKFKSILKSSEEEEGEEKSSFLSGLKFTRDLGKDPDFNQDFTQTVDDIADDVNPADSGVIDDIDVDVNPADSGVIDDIEVEENDFEKTSPKSNVKFTSKMDFDSDESVSEDVENVEPDDDFIVVEHEETPEAPELDDDFVVVEHEKTAKETSKKSKSRKKSPEPVIEDEKVDLGSDDGYIYVDHSHDDERVLDDESDLGFGEKIDIDDDKVDLGSQMNEKTDFDDEEKVDLGSDDDYIYVDHSHDEEHVLDDEEPVGYEFEAGSTEENTDVDVDEKPQSHRRRSMRTSSVKSIISDVISGEPKLEKEEVETVRGEIIQEEEVPLHKPAPKDDSVVEAEIVDGDEELNIFTDNFDDEDDTLEKPTPKMDYTEDEELNIFTDELPDLRNDNRKEHNEVVSKAMEGFLDGLFDNEELQKEVYPEREFSQEPAEREDTPEKEIRQEPPRREAYPEREIRQEPPRREAYPEREIRQEPPQSDATVENVQFRPSVDIPHEEADEVIRPEPEFEIPQEEVVEEVRPEPKEEVGDGVTYYQGSNDVTSKLRKNNFYYEEEKPKSVKESIRGIKKDMQYINKSLKEIENPTHIDYVSVVDRTEEFDPMDYLNRPSDDDSDKILQKEQELTFAEKEEIRIEEEMRMDALRNEISNEEDVIVPVHEQFRREELKDQALEDIILSANEDYKEIERERHQKDNQLKAFDDQVLPGRGKMEDNIVNYVEIDDIGLHSSDELYKQPIEKVAKSINDIVDIEGPIHVKEVTNRVKDACHIKRAGSNLKKRVNAAISEAESSGDIIRIGDFLYDASNNNIVIRKRNKPNIDLISDEEIAKNIETVLLHKQNVTTGQIAKETSRNFGFRSTSKKTATRINSVLDLMIANNKVKIENDIVELK